MATKKELKKIAVQNAWAGAIPDGTKFPLAAGPRVRGSKLGKISKANETRNGAQNGG